MLYALVKFDVSIFTSNGNFVVMEGDALVAAGRIRVANEESTMQLADLQIRHVGAKFDEDPFVLNTTDVYKDYLLRGYDYGNEFRCIHKATLSGDRSLIRWDNNWVSFIDCLLQTRLLSDHEGTLLLPVRMEGLRIDPQKHLKNVETVGKPLAEW